MFLASFIVGNATYNGHAFPLLFAESPELSNWAFPVTVDLYCIFGLVFAILFLDLKARRPATYARTKRVFAGIGITFVVTALADGYRAAVIGAVVWVILYSIFMIYLGFSSLRTRNRAATFFLYGSLAGLCGSVTTDLTAMGVLPYSFMTFRAVDLGILCDAILLALALAERVSQARRLERLRRFFSPAVADKLLSVRSEELYRPHRREIVVVFLDLRGYTAFTVQYGADDVMRVLGEFHAAMGRLISASAATLERFTGDGIMLVFNDPVEIADPALTACRMAIAMQDEFTNLCALWAERGYNLSLGIGIAQGIATIGAIGFEGRRDYSAIGTVPNLAARLCAEAAGGQILLSDVVARNIGEKLQLRALPPLSLKGFSDPVVCFELNHRSEHALTRPDPIHERAGVPNAVG